jgi:fumarate hydratase subunit beta
MDVFTPTMMDQGVVATIGKGPRSEEVRSAIVKNRGLYLVAFGGCGALYAQCVKKSRIIAFEEDGPEALLEIEVENFPVIVGMDCKGNSVFDKKR